MSGLISAAAARLRAALVASSGAALVGFIASGVGAVFRTVRDKLRERVSVMDFGAIGDDVADDTAAINAAIAAAPAGALIDFCGRSYKVTTITANKARQKLVNGRLTAAAGTGALVLVTGNGVTIEGLDTFIDGAAFAVSRGAFGFNGVTGGTVRNCSIDGARRSGPASVSAHGVAVFASSGVQITGNTINNGVFTEHVYIDGSTRCRVVGNHMENGDYSAVALVSPIGTAGNHLVSANNLYDFGTSIITVDCDGCSITGNVLEKSDAEQGINVGHTGQTTGHRTLVSGNTIKAAVGFGVAVADSRGVLVVGNTITGAEKAVRFAGSSNDGAVIGNVITDTTLSGILFSIGDARASFVIKSNTLRNIDAHGIEAIGGTRYEVTGNTFINVHNRAGGLPGGRAVMFWDGSAGTNKPERLICTGNTAANDANLAGLGATARVGIRNSVAALKVTLSGNDFEVVAGAGLTVTGTAPRVDGADVVIDWTPALTTNTGAFGALTVTRARYSVVGKRLHVHVACAASVASGAPNEFRLSHPYGVSPNSDIYAPAVISVGGVNEVGMLRQTTGGYFSFFRLNASAFAGAVTVTGSFTIELA